MNRTDVNNILDLLLKSEKVLILGHKNPDGDAVGSALAMKHYLRAKGVNGKVMFPDTMPDFLKWLPEADKSSIYKYSKKTSKQIIAECKAIICLDFNNLQRLDTELGQLIEDAQIPKVMIDHHLAPADHFDHMISLPEKSSTCEIVFDFIAAAGDKSLIDRSIANCLYVGLMTDTGNFSFSLSPHVFDTAKHLLEAGCQPSVVHNMVYNSASESRVKLLGFALFERLKVIKEFNTAYIALSEKDMSQFDFQKGDTEGLVNYCLSMKDIHVGVLLRENNGVIRISLRSQGNFSVNTFSRRHFDGGGHRNAAGGNSFLSLEETVEKFEKLLPLYKEEIANSLKNNED